ncbi:helix-turn-helix domain-containing protein [Bradyrhizobium sp. CCBAU 21359]|uniref:helix-turn-helix domain-containing protein n=1 Tax=Bradyrhizobium sp. CCBAU 21359 TaxID=1325080 RepID=UPI00230596A1|nr:helix-turn-helix domain-containing protein [Bradyrhizobium sp. CCBAU 21359]
MPRRAGLGCPLAWWRSYGITGEEQSHRRDPLRHSGRCDRSSSCPRASDARQRHQRGPQPRPQADGAGQQLDTRRSLRNHHAISAYREGECAERAEVSLGEAATALKVSPSTVRHLIKEQSLPAQQLCKGAPWMIKAVDLERTDVKRAAHARSGGRRLAIRVKKKLNSKG